jgi:hypothetical protein
VPEVGAVGARRGCSILIRQCNTRAIILGIGGVANHSHRFASEQDDDYFARAQVVQDFLRRDRSVPRSGPRDQAAREGVRREAGGGVQRRGLLPAGVRESGLRNLWAPFAPLIDYESRTRGP